MILLLLLTICVYACLSLLEAHPLEIQSSHLSFQEFFAARAICKGMQLPPASAKPWQWPPWWQNLLRLGADMPNVRKEGANTQQHLSDAHVLTSSAFHARSLDQACSSR